MSIERFHSRGQPPYAGSQSTPSDIIYFYSQLQIGSLNVLGSDMIGRLNLAVKETVGLFENSVDRMLYVNLQAAVLQQKLEHSIKAECYCCWSRALHSGQLRDL